MNGSPHKFAFYVGESADYATFFVGRSFDAATSYGGQVELRAGEYRLVFNDGVNLRFNEKPSDYPAKHQMLIVFADKSALSASVAMYGGLMGFREGEYDNPYREVATLAADETTRLYKTLRGLLQQMVDGGGRDTEKDLFGHSGRYVARMSKLHIDGGCPECGSSIRKEAYMGGSIYFCPTCQIL